MTFSFTHITTCTVCWQQHLWVYVISTPKTILCMLAGGRTVPCREHFCSHWALDLLQRWVSGCIGAIQYPLSPHCCSIAFHPLDHALSKSLPGSLRDSNVFLSPPPHLTAFPTLSPWPPCSREDPPSWHPLVPLFSTSACLGLDSVSLLSRAELIYSPFVLVFKSQSDLSEI